MMRNESFVGRARELAQLQAALARASSGRGQLVMLSGEAGIGKTRTAQELAGQAERDGFLVFWGRCHEEPGAPPYWPWVQLLRTFVEANDGQSLRSAMGTNASIIADIVPELSERLTDLKSLVPLTDPAQARFRLFDAITTFWKRVASEQPYVLIFDNVQWADTPSLRLLEFLAPELESSGLFVLGTYRDSDLSSEHPLRNTLGDLGRHNFYTRMRLPGLTLEESRELLNRAVGATLPIRLVETLYDQTEGNPLFLVEITRFLTQEDAFSPAVGTAYPRLEGLLKRIRTGVRDVIGRRLNRLSPLCNRVLGNAAVIGRSFDRVVLDRLLEDLSDNQRIVALEEACAAHIIDMRREGNCQFCHALFQEALYDEMPPPRRLALHQKIGEALEDLHRRDLTPVLSMLARHFSAALPSGDVAKAVQLSRLAGEHADSMFAYEEAARCYQLAVDALALHKPVDPVQRCQLLIALGEAQWKIGQELPALVSFRDAVEAAKQGGLVDALVRAALGFENASWVTGLPGHAAVRLLEQALSVLEERDGVERAKLLSALARATSFTPSSEQAWAIADLATDMARRIGDAQTLASVMLTRLWMTWKVDRAREFVAIADEAIRAAEQAGDRGMLRIAIGRKINCLLIVGDLENLWPQFEHFEREGVALRQPYLQYWPLAIRAALALFQGHFKKSEDFAQRALALGQRWTAGDAQGVYGLQMFTLRREQGRLQELAPLVDYFLKSASKGATWLPGLAIIHCELGRREEARRLFEQLAPHDFSAIPRDALWEGSIAYLAEVCCFLGDSQRASTLHRMLLPYDGLNIAVGSTVAIFGAASRLLGMLAATMKQWSEAERHFRAALEMNERQEARPWVAHTQYQYAAMLLARGENGDHGRAADLLSQALETARGLGMAALEERALALLDKAARERDGDHYPAGLTDREVEVLRLVAAGKSNREIGERLFVSPNTAANHVRNILSKIEAANRTEAAVFAIQHGLVTASE